MRSRALAVGVLVAGANVLAGLAAAADAPPRKKTTITAAPGRDGSLAAQDRLTSPDGVYTLVMQADGNLVVSRTECLGTAGCALWSTRTIRAGGPFALLLRQDGNLLVVEKQARGSPEKVVWETKTAGPPGRSYLHLQNDGNLVLYRSLGTSEERVPVWSWKAGRHTP